MPEKNPQNRHLGYARVSTYGQTFGAQLDQLRAAGCTQIFREKVTGARADRRELLRCQRRPNFPQKWRSKIPHFDAEAV